MSRYVDIDKEIERAERSLAVRSEFGEDETDDGYLYLKSYIEELKKIPTADVEEVRRGEWVHGRESHREYIGDALINIYYENFTCSCCGYLIDDKHYSRIFYKRCPECGAHMRREQ